LIMIQKYKDIHDGERIFVIGNGPSARNLPFEQLENEYTIALNKISMIYKLTPWRPTYYVYFDAASKYRNGDFPKENIDAIQMNIDQGITCFLSQETSQYIRDDGHVVYYQAYWERAAELLDSAVENRDISLVWSEDLSRGIFNWGSTISVAAQIAVYMGFDQLYFVGCDLYKPYKIPYTLFEEADHPVKFDFRLFENVFQKLKFYADESYPVTKSFVNLIYYQAIYLKYVKILNQIYPGFSSRDHIRPGYRANSVRIPELWNESLQKIHQVIKLASYEYGFEAFNATPGGYLDTYERVDLSNLIS